MTEKDVKKIKRQKIDFYLQTGALRTVRWSKYTTAGNHKATTTFAPPLQPLSGLLR